MLYIIAQIDENLVVSGTHQVVKRKVLDQYYRYNETWNPKYCLTQVINKNMCFEI